MQISLILAHPDRNSFNHAIALTCLAQLEQIGHQVFFHDLYEEKFDPVLPGNELKDDILLPDLIEQHCHEIAMADGIVIVHPNWWGQPPAILKGWVDRVLRAGVAYRFLEGDNGEGVPVGLLKARIAIVFNTSNTPMEREVSVFGDPLETLWKNCIFDLCGARNFYRETFGVMVTSSDAQRKLWLEKVRDVVNRYFPA
jgi:NAD(P)H dehydrogenase (quinone)